MKKDIHDKLAVLTSQPGVYIMKNKDGDVIYVGKAKNLKNRVSQYFTSNSSHSLKVLKMVSNVDNFEYIVTSSELEALILENNLIKQYKPKYNILLKDDKAYPYIALEKKTDYPRFTLARRRDNNDYRYFGPFVSSQTVREIIKTVNSIFGLYSCKKNFPRDFSKSRPCLNYHIGKCPGICTGKITKEQYKSSIDQAIRFLNGDYKQLLHELEKNMEELSDNLEFEKAAVLRDRINSIKRLESKQVIVLAPEVNRDIIAYSELEGEVCFSVMHIRKGKIIFQDTHFLTDNSEDIMGVFLERYYGQNELIPRDIAVSQLPASCDLLCQWLSVKTGAKIRIFEAQKGENTRLIDMCRKNAAEKLAEKKANGIRTSKLMGQIAQILGMDEIPGRFEMYDVSNFGHDSIVGGMIVWENGRFRKSEYKKFKFDNADSQDDYRYTYEMIARRLKRLENGSEGFRKKPDIIFVDGGAGHLGAVYELISGYNIKAFGLVKDRKHRTRGVVGISGEVDIRTNPAIYKFFTQLQDEVHRYAITYMQNKKKVNMFDSEIMRVEGIGKSRYKALMDKFKTADSIKNASVDQLTSVRGISAELAERIIEDLNRG